MRGLCRMLVIAVWVLLAMPLSGQQSENCFLQDWEPRSITVPPFEDVPKITAPWSIRVIVNATDTLRKVSQYIFGNAVAVWVGPNQNNPTLASHLQKLSPALIRFPGGSWSDIYFWNGNPGDLPSAILGDNGQPNPQHAPQFGPNYSLTPDQYYSLCEQVGTQGLITINYGYARYGAGEKPVERAAHLAADWVRYDNGRTRFWELGNENAGTWEAGYRIDTTINKDGQPMIISGELYGKHFNIIADSMRAAAAERGATIFIGGQVLHFAGTSGADVQWNEGFFREAGNSVDFYVMHNYFNSNNSTNPLTLLNFASTELKKNADFIQQDIAAKGAAPRPLALTEYNMGGSNTAANASFIKGMQAVILFCELLKNNFGMASRWLVSSWQTDGMFDNGTPGVPLWTPRPEFYYQYFTQQFMGDHLVNASVPGSQSVVAYASRFASGHLAVIIVNKGTAVYTATLTPDNYGFGNRFYVYSLTGGTDNGNFSQVVSVNDEGASAPAWGPPMEMLEGIPAYAYPTDGNEIKFPLPGRSVQFILLEPGNRVVSVKDDEQAGINLEFELQQNYPNPFNPTTVISYQLPVASRVRLMVFNVLGQEVATLVDGELKAGRHQAEWDATGFPSGVYVYRLEAGRFSATRLMLMVK